MRAAVVRAAEGSAPVNVALMQLIMTANDELELISQLELARADLLNGAERAAVRIAAMLDILRGDPGVWRTVKTVATEVERATGEERASPRFWASLFDGIAATSPQAGAALYCLGREDMLDAATASIMARLREWGLLSAPLRVLDLGCGPGRLCAALAPNVHHVTGSDVSSGMLAAARERCRELGNVRLVQVSGADLDGFVDGTFDLVVAIDVFPYLVDCGESVVARHLTGIARVLSRGGGVLIANYSYRGDRAEDERDMRRLASDAGLDVVRIGSGDFELWDGVAYQLHRTNGRSTQPL